MPHDIALAYLVITRREEPPPPADVARKVAGAGMGVFDYEAADLSSGPLAGGRQRLGTYTGKVTGFTIKARVTVWRASEPVTTGMGEAALNGLANGLTPEDARILREGKLSLDLRATTRDAYAHPVLDWMTQLAYVLAELCGGVVMDPLAQRCSSAQALARIQPGDVLAHITMHNEPWDVESRWQHTHGLQKFGQPELDLVDVPISLADEAEAFLRDLAVNLAGGAHLAAGGEVDMEDLGTLVAVSALADVDHQAAFGRLRLADSPLADERQGIAATRFLKRAALAEAARKRMTGDIEGALRDVDRVLAADPDECGALALKAQIYLNKGQITDALDLGELMQLRVPDDYRGPLCAGMALAALERYREALHELERAIEREPEAAEAFAVRAEVYERLGQEQRAAMDRARVAYLSS